MTTAAEVVLAETRAKEARARFMASLGDAQVRLNPKALAHEAMDNAAQRASNAARDAGQRASDVATEAAQRAGVAAREVAEVARARPWAAAATVAALGLLLVRKPVGRLLRRRREPEATESVPEGTVIDAAGPRATGDPSKS